MSSQSFRVTCALAISAVAMSLAMAADTPQLKVKMGLWEISTQIQMSGAPAIPDDVLQKLPPEQRARMQAALAGMNKPQLLKECMTPDRLKDGFKASDRDEGACKRTIVTNTSSELVVKSECGDADNQRTATVHFTANSSESITGVIQAVAMRQGKAMNVNGTVNGKWIGSDCGSVKDVETEKSAP